MSDNLNKVFEEILNMYFVKLNDKTKLVHDATETATQALTTLLEAEYERGIQIGHDAEYETMTRKINNKKKG